jgi:hypothetical protein
MVAKKPEYTSQWGIEIEKAKLTAAWYKRKWERLKAVQEADPEAVSIQDLDDAEYYYDMAELQVMALCYKIHPV